MAGYNWERGISNNAVWAYEEGLRPYSKLTAWQKRAVDAGAVQPREWHHTSARFNRTNFYAPEDFDELNPADFPPQKKSAPTVDRFVVLVSAVWGGTRKHPRIVGKTADLVVNPSEKNLACRKYNDWGGYSREFSTEDAARAFIAAREY